MKRFGKQLQHDPELEIEERGLYVQVVEPSGEIVPEDRGVEVLVESAESLGSEADSEGPPEELAGGKDHDNEAVDR
jgi:hypothetical protein